MARYKNYLYILLSVAIVGVTAFISSILTNTDSEWYLSLIKPDFQPPGIVFSIVWTVVYILSAVSLSASFIFKVSRRVIILFIVQLIMQILWCLVFFTLYQAALGLLILVALVIINNILTVKLFSPREWVGWVYFPVFCWIVFACTLNYAIVMLN